MPALGFVSMMTRVALIPALWSAGVAVVLSAGGGRTLKEACRRALERVPEGSFSSWRAEDAETLLLLGEAGTGWRVTFARPCKGLESATAVSFVTPATGALDAYDSILLDDGTRCRFARAVPTVMD